ncbi:hypothetical protein [Nocardioides sp. B-3]|uniref:hypothetical protein n=1 Tax=Nocardioides sp. B-3 TaxID=2895565 RepID=UPI0021539545|nr:hypothetical protein LP418_21970 [Nocardioides sp. B-3]
MKLLKQGVALAMVGVGLVAAPALQAQATPAATSAKADNGVQAMKNEATGLVALSGESATGHVGFIRLKGNGDLMPSKSASSKTSAATKADAYLDKYAANFGARSDELARDGVTSSPAGWTVTYTRAFRGVPVFGSMLRAHVDKQGDLTSVNGFAAPDLSLSTTTPASTPPPPVSVPSAPCARTRPATRATPTPRASEPPGPSWRSTARARPRVSRVRRSRPGSWRSPTTPTCATC